MTQSGVISMSATSYVIIQKYKGLLEADTKGDNCGHQNG